jgi:hypothetical protein
VELWRRGCKIWSWGCRKQARRPASKDRFSS